MAHRFALAITKKKTGHVEQVVYHDTKAMLSLYALNNLKKSQHAYLVDLDTCDLLMEYEGTPTFPKAIELEDGWFLNYEIVQSLREQDC